VADRTGSARASTKPAARAAKPKRRRRRFRAVWRRLVFVSLVVVIALIGGMFALMDAVEIPPTKVSAETSFVCLASVADGQCGQNNSVAQFSGTENRVMIPYDQIPRVLIQAVVAAEDQGYFRHSGIDPLGIARALFQTVTGSSGSQQGGSTITQQYVKNAFLTTERTLGRKLREAALAIKLEKTLTKEQILERYLNEIYFGRGAYGVEAAARAYFGVPAKELTLDEAALLAALIRSPESADPLKGAAEEKTAKRRRSSVLNAMVSIGSITPEQAKTADAVPFAGSVVPRTNHSNNTIVSQDFASVGGSYIAEWVRQQVQKKVGTKAAYTKGLRIYLTIDDADQRSAAAAIRKSLGQPNDPAAALVSIDEQGRIRAMVGGQNFEEEQTNFALGQAGGGSGRQAGSTFKPFALAAFVAQGNSVESVYPGPPSLVLPRADNGLDWEVTNYDNEDLGNITVRQATWKSVNTVYAQIMQKVGARAVADMAKTAGVTAPIKKVNSTVLGTSDVSVLDMATAYSTFANHGVLVQPFILRRIETPTGDVLFDAGAAPRSQAITPDVADTVTSVLRGVLTPQGTGSAARIRKDAAGKTGTTSNYKDAWFAGYTCHTTTAVWLGYPQGQPMTSVHGSIKVTGGSLPATIWHDYMGPATADEDKCTYRDIDAGTTKVNPDLVAGPPTSTIAPPPGAPLPPGVTTTVVPGTPSAPTTPAPTATTTKP